jgi:5-methylcytosine-specific restriction endonuclease McrA
MFTQCSECGDTITNDEVGSECPRNDNGHQVWE